MPKFADVPSGPTPTANHPAPPAPRPTGPRLDERALRRPDGLFDCSVILADGQEWLLPRAETYWTLGDNEDGVAEVQVLGDEFARLTDARRVAAEGGDAGFVAAELALGRWLLARNYNLPPGAASTLLRFGYTVGTLETDIRNSVIAIVEGRAPRPQPSELAATA